MLYGTSKYSESAVAGGFDPGIRRMRPPGIPCTDPQTEPSGAGATP